ncbi:hypothetical protein PQX77_019277 [Marasmius sp. AFHP31]|nr:hypothetical protein PQX77_019277 [Marasmius sp. AFHP31]
MSPNSNSSPPFLFQSDEGRQIIRAIAKKRLTSFDPHDYSVEVAAGILDRQDVLVRAGCGAGKTGTIALVAVVFEEILRDRTLVPNFKPWFHKEDPAIVVICPTDALEINIESKMLLLGISAVALNSKVIGKAEKARQANELWERASRARILLMSPELLQSDTLRDRLELDKPEKESKFKSRCSLLVCNEVHLVYTWGRRFRKAYKNIGRMRARLGSPGLLLLTATLQDGKRLSWVLKYFGLIPGEYLDVHLSNWRPEICVITSTLESSLASSYNFPEFRWIVGLSGITILFIPDQSTALRITLY